MGTGLFFGGYHTNEHNFDSFKKFIDARPIILYNKE